MSISINPNKIKCKCLFCKREFEKWLCRIKVGKGKFCSRFCTDQYKKKFNLVKNKNNPSWKGGKTKTSTGYIWVRNINHPKNMHGYILEHRIIMEKFLGRYLTSTEVIHHINFDKSDNRIENLKIVTRQTHKKEHPLKRDSNGRFIAIYTP